MQGEGDTKVDTNWDYLWSSWKDACTHTTQE